MRDVRSWWLGIAKNLWVGDHTRKTHPADRGSRPSVIIRNEPQGYSVWCHRRNTGDYVAKTHVIPRTAPAGSEHDNLPTDLRVITDLPYHEQTSIESYMLSMGVTSSMLPKGSISWSDSRKRLVITLGNITLGRDVTNTSNCKWVDYTPAVTNHTEMLKLDGVGGDIVLVEDTFSAVKVNHYTNKTTVALLGTRLHDIHRLEILDRDRTFIALDGDVAGRRGTTKIIRELRAMDCRYYFPVYVPTGNDPKNLTAAQIRELLNGSTT